MLVKRAVLLVLALSLLQVGGVYFEEDFVDVSDWGLYAGIGSMSNGGLVVGNDSVAFKTVFSNFDTFKKTCETIVSSINGFFVLYLAESTNGNLLRVYNGSVAGAYSAQLASSVDVNALVLAVTGSADFELIRVIEASGVSRGGLFGYLEGLLMEFVAANPWVMPTALALAVVVIGALLAFGKSKKRRRR
jgi:hypothetical protein